MYGVLSRTFFFKGLGEDELKPLLESVGSGAELRQFRRGHVIYTPESFRRELGLIVTGRVLVTKGTLTVSELTEGDIFGAAALFNAEEQYASTLTALVPCQVLFLDQEAVSALIDKSKMIRENYIRYLSGRIRFLSAKVDALSSGTGESRLARYLLKNAGDTGSVTVRSMTELASRLGISRASLYRELDKLTDRGAISRSGRTITLLEPELL